MDRAPIKIALLLDTLAALLGLISGCQPAGPLGQAGVELTPPASWRPVEASAQIVPGVPLAAWSGPDGSSLVLYRTLWVPAGTAEMLAEALGNRLENLPGLRLLVKRTETAGGRAAARVEVVAPGTGGALAATGLGTPVEPTGKTLFPTRQVTLGFARPGDTLYLTWHVPESSYQQIAPEIQTTLDSLRFAASGKPSSSAD
ncbi:MAG: hypothetical protein ACHRXM_11910 [Isosphaerales bacterium]